MSEKKLNPQIHEVPIGTRELRKIKIYPLAAGHQLELTDLISDSVAAFMEIEGKGEDMIKFVSFILGLIKENIGRIIKYITEENESILMEISNDQLADIVEIVYKENFEGPIKKVQALFLKGRENINPQSKKPAQPSVRRTVTH